MNIVIAADPFALELKDSVKKHLEEQGYTLIDVGAAHDREDGSSGRWPVERPIVWFIRVLMHKKGSLQAAFSSEHAGLSQ